MTKPEYLDAASDIELDDIVMVTHNDAGRTTETLTGEKLKKTFSQTFIAQCTTGASTASKAVTGPKIKWENGTCIKVFFANGNTAANMTLTYNSTTAAIKIYKDGTKSNPALNPMNAGTILELMVDENDFIIVGNPVVSSGNDYTIYADGTIRQYGQTQLSISSIGGEQEITTFKGNSIKSVQAVRTHGGNSTAIYNFVYYSNKKLYAYYASQGSSSSYATGGYVYYEFIGTV